ncbi:DUF4260 family protein [Streptomyces sp. AN091965]|uniref:DUF4260 family protein n=1 Tax=Streptomyces sp. AN091965 TaxID=2927803 RepID=UPI001F61139E|nr:DUF4260 family protein [Streptomyces sp. AN091965]MCI3930351.1 DUF4260 domain-containing protein [Streptomyces sp. AN091965]
MAAVATPAPKAPARTAVRVVLRVGWFAAAVFWTVLAVLEGVHHGWPAGTAALLFALAPDLALFVGLGEAPRTARGQLPPRAVPYYNAAHRALVPLALLAVYTVVPLTWPPVLAALCGWLAHISYDRAFGYGLRTKEGFQRG